MYIAVWRSIGIKYTKIQQWIVQQQRASAFSSRISAECLVQLRAPGWARATVETAAWVFRQTCTDESDKSGYIGVVYCVADQRLLWRLGVRGCNKSPSRIRFVTGAGIMYCRMTNHELLRWLVETPSRDVDHYRMINASRSTVCHYNDKRSRDRLSL